jgi:hypothetical protein
MKLKNIKETIPAALNNHQAFGSSKLCLAGGWKEAFYDVENFADF